MFQDEEVVCVEPGQEEQAVEPKHSLTAEKETNRCSTGPSLDDKLQHRMPRLYYIVIFIVFPLLTLIALSFLFGWALAKLEMQGEIQRNDAAMVKVCERYGNHTAKQKSVWYAMANTSGKCLAQSLDEEVLQIIPNLATTTQTIEQCSLMEGMEQFPFFDVLVHEEPELSFDWMKCYKDPRPNEQRPADDFSQNFGLNPENNHDQQWLKYILRFADSLEERILTEYPGKDTEWIFENPDLVSHLGREASGSLGCKVHTAGGSLFWFTIMTTIGYGNTAPATHGGRLLVFICGFITIIGFLFLNNTAAEVWKLLVEDWFLRCKMEQLVTGPLSVLFWLGMTLVWMLFIALSVQSYQQKRIEEEMTLGNAYWFSFITTTTVGLGDIHFSHEEFAVGDMFVVPVLVLLGFNFLGIFAMKLVDLKHLYFPAECGLKEILQERRGGHGQSAMPSTDI